MPPTSPGGLQVRTPEDEEEMDEAPTDMESDGIDNAADVAHYSGVGVASERGGA